MEHNDNNIALFFLVLLHIIPINYLNLFYLFLEISVKCVLI